MCYVRLVLHLKALSTVEEYGIKEKVRRIVAHIINILWVT